MKHHQDNHQPSDHGNKNYEVINEPSQDEGPSLPGSCTKKTEDRLADPAHDKNSSQVEKDEVRGGKDQRDGQREHRGKRMAQATSVTTAAINPIPTDAQGLIT
jgi:hypothetical protein